MSAFVKATAIRAARTVAQTAVALLGPAQLFADVDWEVVVSGAGFAGLLSVLTAVATGLPEAPKAD